MTLVGAVYGNDGIGNSIELFSDTGPIQLEVPTPSTLQAPHLVAPDGVFVDTSGTQFIANGGLFYGNIGRFNECGRSSSVVAVGLSDTNADSDHYLHGDGCGSAG